MLADLGGSGGNGGNGETSYPKVVKGEARWYAWQRPMQDDAG